LASGKDVGGLNRKFVKDQGYAELIPEAKELLKAHRKQIKLPKDMAFENKGKRAEASIDNFPDKKSLDIGKETMENFSKEVKRAKIVIAKGPTGVFEINGFGLGTETLLRSIAESNALSVIGGGHLTTVAKAAGLKDRITHIGSGGGATVSYLSNQPLPGIEAIKKAAKGNR
jgi:phosphoglycerate kinase